MSAPDPFAVARVDAELIEAERKLLDLNAQSNAMLAIENPEVVDDNGYPLGWQDLRDQINELDGMIFTTPAIGFAGAAVKLRRVLDPEIGLFPCGETDYHEPCLREVLALIEREAGAPR